jgi:hypothetical protein
MDHQGWKPQDPNEQKERKHGGTTLGIILIFVGIYWIVKETGLGAYLPGWEFYRDAFFDIYSFLRINLGDFLLPVLLVITGLLMISGRRRVGGLIALIVLLLFLPGLIIPGVLMIVFFPVVLIIIGVMLIKSLL